MLYIVILKTLFLCGYGSKINFFLNVEMFVSKYDKIVVFTNLKWTII